MAIESTDRLLTVGEVAERLHVHPITVRRMIKAGRLPVVRIGRAVRLREKDVLALSGFQPTERLGLPPWPPAPGEMQERRRVMEETFARRDRRGNIGIDTLELVRASRRELEERSEQS